MRLGMRLYDQALAVQLAEEDTSDAAWIGWWVCWAFRTPVPVA